jgi:hypothetical protein
MVTSTRASADDDLEVRDLDLLLRQAPQETRRQRTADRREQQFDRRRRLVLDVEARGLADGDVVVAQRGLRAHAAGPAHARLPDVLARALQVRGERLVVALLLEQVVRVAAVRGRRRTQFVADHAAPRRQVLLDRGLAALDEQVTAGRERRHRRADDQEQTAAAVEVAAVTDGIGRRQRVVQGHVSS